MPQQEPFWLCHECGAQMRPITIDGVSHCASCNGEFIEILDSEINPDPFHELPPPPPTRPGAPNEQNPQTAPTTGGGFSNILSSLFGTVPLGQQQHQQQNQDQASNHRGPRTYTWNLGGGHGSITFGRIDGVNPFGGGAGSLDAFFPGFPVPPRGEQTRDGGDLNGVDLLQALLAVLHEDGVNEGPRGNLGDYVMSDQGFNDVLERLMQAAGPQGPLPASDVVIEGLPRIKFQDEASLEKSPFKDCPVCKDDFLVGDEVMRIPCQHIFHPDCLQPWLRVNGSCPVCRFSLVPEEGNQRRSPNSPNASDAPSRPGTQNTVTSILNRLWGQGGSSSSNEQPPSSAEPSTTPARDEPGSTSNTEATGQLSAPESANSSSDPDSIRLSSDIPQDYRERHARREREQQQQQQQLAPDHDPYLDDLD